MSSCAPEQLGSDAAGRLYKCAPMHVSCQCEGVRTHAAKKAVEPLEPCSPVRSASLLHFI